MSADTSDPALASAVQAVHAQEDPTNWLVAAYASPTSTAIVLVDSGPDPALPALRAHIDAPAKTNGASFAFATVAGLGLVVLRIGDGIGGVRRAKAVLHSRAFASLFPDYLALATVTRPGELTDGFVAERLGLTPEAIADAAATGAQIDEIDNVAGGDDAPHAETDTCAATEPPPQPAPVPPAVPIPAAAAVMPAAPIPAAAQISPPAPAPAAPTPAPPAARSPKDASTSRILRTRASPPQPNVPSAQFAEPTRTNLPTPSKIRAQQVAAAPTSSPSARAPLAASLPPPPKTPEPAAAAGVPRVVSDPIAKPPPAERPRTPNASAAAAARRYSQISAAARLTPESSTSSHAAPSSIPRYSPFRASYSTPLADHDLPDLPTPEVSDAESDGLAPVHARVFQRPASSSPKPDKIATAAKMLEPDEPESPTPDHRSPVDLAAAAADLDDVPELSLHELEDTLSPKAFNLPDIAARTPETPDDLQLLSPESGTMSPHGQPPPVTARSPRRKLDSLPPPVAGSTHHSRSPSAPSVASGASAHSAATPPLGSEPPPIPRRSIHRMSMTPPTHTPPMMPPVFSPAVPLPPTSVPSVPASVHSTPPMASTSSFAQFNNPPPGTFGPSASSVMGPQLSPRVDHSPPLPKDRAERQPPTAYSHSPHPAQAPSNRRSPTASPALRPSRLPIPPADAPLPPARRSPSMPSLSTLSGPAVPPPNAVVQVTASPGKAERNWLGLRKGSFGSASKPQPIPQPPLPIRQVSAPLYPTSEAMTRLRSREGDLMYRSKSRESDMQRTKSRESDMHRTKSRDEPTYQLKSRERAHQRAAAAAAAAMQTTEAARAHNRSRTHSQASTVSRRSEGHASGHGPHDSMPEGRAVSVPHPGELGRPRKRDPRDQRSRDMLEQRRHVNAITMYGAGSGMVGLGLGLVEPLYRGGVSREAVPQTLAAVPQRTSSREAMSREPSKDSNASSRGRHMTPSQLLGHRSDSVESERQSHSRKASRGDNPPTASASALRKTSTDQIMKKPSPPASTVATLTPPGTYPAQPTPPLPTPDAVPPLPANARVRLSGGSSPRPPPPPSPAPDVPLPPLPPPGASDGRRESIRDHRGREHHIVSPGKGRGHNREPTEYDIDKILADVQGKRHAADEYDEFDEFEEYELAGITAGRDSMHSLQSSHAPLEPLPPLPQAAMPAQVQLSPLLHQGPASSSDAFVTPSSTPRRSTVDSALLTTTPPRGTSLRDASRDSSHSVLSELSVSASEQEHEHDREPPRLATTLATPTHNDFLLTPLSPEDQTDAPTEPTAAPPNPALLSSLPQSSSTLNVPSTPSTPPFDGQSPISAAASPLSPDALDLNELMSAVTGAVSIRPAAARVVDLSALNGGGSRAGSVPSLKLKDKEKEAEKTVTGTPANGMMAAVVHITADARHGLGLGLPTDTDRKITPASPDATTETHPSSTASSPLSPTSQSHTTAPTSPRPENDQEEKETIKDKETTKETETIKEARTTPDVAVASTARENPSDKSRPVTVVVDLSEMSPVPQRKASMPAGILKLDSSVGSHGSPMSANPVSSNSAFSTSTGTLERGASSGRKMSLFRSPKVSIGIAASPIEPPSPSGGQRSRTASISRAFRLRRGSNATLSPISPSVTGPRQSPRSVSSPSESKEENLKGLGIFGASGSGYRTATGGIGYTPPVKKGHSPSLSTSRHSHSPSISSSRHSPSLSISRPPISPAPTSEAALYAAARQKEIADHHEAFEKWRRAEEERARQRAAGNVHAAPTAPPAQTLPQHLLSIDRVIEVPAERKEQVEETMADTIIEEQEEQVVEIAASERVREASKRRRTPPSKHSSPPTDHIEKHADAPQSVRSSPHSDIDDPPRRIPVPADPPRTIPAPADPLPKEPTRPRPAELNIAPGESNRLTASAVEDVLPTRRRGPIVPRPESHVISMATSSIIGSEEMGSDEVPQTLHLAVLKPLGSPVVMSPVEQLTSAAMSARAHRRNRSTSDSGRIEYASTTDSQTSSPRETAMRIPVPAGSQSTPAGHVETLGSPRHPQSVNASPLSVPSTKSANLEVPVSPREAEMLALRQQHEAEVAAERAAYAEKERAEQARREAVVQAGFEAARLKAERLEAERARQAQFAKEKAERDAAAKAEKERQAAERAAEERAAQDVRLAGVRAQLRTGKKDGSIMLRGWVTVQTMASLTWRRRYFHLLGDELRMFKNDSDDAPLTVVGLRGGKVTETYEDSQVKGSWSLKDGKGEEMFMFADTPEDQDIILKGLAVAIGTA